VSIATAFLGLAFLRIESSYTNKRESCSQYVRMHMRKPAVSLVIVLEKNRLNETYHALPTLKISSVLSSMSSLYSIQRNIFIRSTGAIHKAARLRGTKYRYIALSSSPCWLLVDEAYTGQDKTSYALNLTSLRPHKYASKSSLRPGFFLLCYN
jgi:hypothetical protein